MSSAPRRFASCARAQKCTLEVIALQPQKMMSFASSATSTSMPMLGPSVIWWPADPAAAQIVRSSRLAPSR